MNDRPTKYAINRYRREVSYVRFQGDIVDVFLLNACNDHGRISDTNRALCFLAADEIERLSADLAASTEENIDLFKQLVAMRQQRDEARREVCRYWALRSVVVLGVYRSALDFAADRGWDCYAKEGGAEWNLTSF